jgi:signal peptidase I
VQGPPAQPRRRRWLKPLIALGILVAAPIAAFLLGIVTGTLRAYRIPSESMEPTYHVGAHVLTARRGFPFGGASRGDVVILNPPPGALSDECGVSHSAQQACPAPKPGRANVTFIKRIVAGPGDRLKILHGQVFVNGRYDDPFKVAPLQCDTCDLPREITIPPGHWFVLGDNRGASDDSRIWGPVATGAIKGRVLFQY